MVAGMMLPSRGRPTTTSSTGRSVRTFATASSSGTRPFMGTSALAVVMIRPGTRAMRGRGRKWVWSTPTGTTVIRSSRTPSCSAMSRLDDSETVMIRGSLRTTRICMRRNPNQRRSVSLRMGEVAWDSSRSRSTVIGWCTVATTGKPSSSRPRMPLARHWLSCTMSKSPRRSRRTRRTRMPKVRGSGKPAVHMSANSITSASEWNSRG